MTAVESGDRGRGKTWRLVSRMQPYCVAFSLLAFFVTAAMAVSADPAAIPGSAAGASSFLVSSGTNAIDFTPGSGSCGSNNSQTIGWQFDVLQAVTVTAMSWFDDGVDGLQLAHEVGIFNPNGNLIASTHVTIPAGTTAVLDGIWRVVPIPPTLLPPGTGYIVAGFNGVHTECLSFDVAQTVLPQLNFVDATFSPIDGIFERPVEPSGAVNGFYGVSFQTGPPRSALAPAVSPVGLAIVALILLAIGRGVVTRHAKRPLTETPARQHS